MLLKCFNCLKCDKPFDCKEGMPNTPTVEGDCADCCPNKSPLWGLIKFLDQPGFTKTDEGYVCNGTILIPKCAACEVLLTAGQRPTILVCGHPVCDNCYTERKVCPECGGSTDEANWFVRLVSFFDAMVEDSLSRQEETAATTAARHAGVLRCCTVCEIEQTVERLFSCIDCTTLVCGVCYFHRHREHSVAPLLGIELTKLKADARNRHDEKLNGLQKNLKFLHQEVEKSITDVITIGQKRLHEIDAQEQFSMARRIASEVDSATDEFEKCFEEYVPVARVFNEKLTQLGEKLQSARAE